MACISSAQSVPLVEKWSSRAHTANRLRTGRANVTRSSQKGVTRCIVREEPKLPPGEFGPPLVGESLGAAH
eukprot:4312092-Pyramimonas_sp.AAC.1